MPRVLLALGVFVVGCDATLPPPDAQGGPRYKVETDFAALRIDSQTHVAGSRRAEEEAALAQLLAMYPPEGAAILAGDLADSSNASIASISDEEAARLLSIIYTIREADRVAKQRELRRELARRLGITPDSVDFMLRVRRARPATQEDSL